MAKSHHITVQTVGSSSPVSLSSARSGRTLIIQNQHATADLWLGGSNVTASNGIYIAAGQNLIFTDNATTSDWWGISTATNNKVMVDEIY